jgi:hypothetical protein
VDADLQRDFPYNHEQRHPPWITDHGTGEERVATRECSPGRDVRVLVPTTRRGEMSFQHPWYW